MISKADHDVIQEVLDGSLSHERFKAFQMRLRQEPALCALYRQYALLHHTLCEEFEGKQSAGIPVRKGSKSSPMQALAVALVAVAAVALFAFVVLNRGRGPETPAVVLQSPPHAQVWFSDDAVWSVDGRQQADGQSARLETGAVVRLQQGQARMDLGDGALAVIDGHSELHFIAPDALRLGHGRGRFRVERKGRELEVSSPAMTVVDLGTEFGMVSRPGRPDEVHVFEGEVQVNLAAAANGPSLVAGEAVRVLNRRTLERIPVSMPRFPQKSPEFQVLLHDRFDSNDAAGDLAGRTPRQGSGVWRVETGTARITGGRLDGGDFTAFCKLPHGAFSARHPILLATLETTEPSDGQFHTDGWAGMSFLQDGQEWVFFGDAFGPALTWAIDVKQGMPVVLPDHLVQGRRTVTFCYCRNTGDASLHEGSLPLGPAFVTGKLPIGLSFDEIRIGASAQSALALISVSVRAGESSADD